MSKLDIKDFRATVGRREALAAIAAMGSGTVWSQGSDAYPNKPIRLMVGFATGGGTDVTARLVAQRLGAQLGQNVIVENRTGASGSIAAADVARAEPDGYRLLMIASGTLFHSALGGKTAYNLERDFTPISMATIGPLVLMVSPNLAARTVPELIAYARANPGRLTFGTDGVGATAHLACEMFNLLAETKMTHVPYKGSGEATVAIASGQVDLGFPSLASATPLLQAGRGRAMALTTTRRSHLLPGVPTVGETLKGYEMAAWFALMGPARMQRPVVDRLHSAMVAVSELAELKEAMVKLGLEAVPMGPEQLSTYMRDQFASVSKLSREANIRID